MSTNRRPSRIAGTGITTSTLMVLVAMASTTSAAAPADGRGHVEPTTVRAMAAVVAAVARDMIGLEPSASAAIIPVAVEGLESSAPVHGQLRVNDGPSPPVPLDERLLDLPPPLV